MDIVSELALVRDRQAADGIDELLSVLEGENAKIRSRERSGRRKEAVESKKERDQLLSQLLAAQQNLY